MREKYYYEEISTVKLHPIGDFSDDSTSSNNVVDILYFHLFSFIFLNPNTKCSIFQNEEPKLTTLTTETSLTTMDQTQIHINKEVDSSSSTLLDQSSKSSLQPSNISKKKRLHSNIENKEEELLTTLSSTTLSLKRNKLNRVTPIRVIGNDTDGYHHLKNNKKQKT